MAFKGIDAAPAAAHIRALLTSCDATLGDVAVACTASKSYVGALAAGSQQAASPEMVNAILAVDAAAVQAAKTARLADRSELHMLVDAAPAAAHLRQLLADPDWGRKCNIHAATGLTRATLNELFNGHKTRVQAITARAVLAVDRSVLRRTAVLCPARIARQRVWSMQAQGWPPKWIADRVGITLTHLCKLTRCNDLTVSRAVFDAIEDLARRVDYRQGPSKTAAAKAKAAGWHPLACYDADGQIIPGAVRTKAEELRARQEEAAKIRVTAVHLSLKGFPTEIVTGLTGINRDALHKRVWREAGLGFEADPCEGNRVQPRPECAEHAAWMKAYLDGQEEAGWPDYLEAALHIGLRSGLKLSHAQLAELRERDEAARDTPEHAGLEAA